MSNLEPIEASDLNLEGKFKGGSEAKKEAAPIQNVEKEIPQEVSSAEKNSAYNKILSKIKTTQPSLNPSDVKSDAQDVFGKTDAESQIQHLVDLAETKGVEHAVKVARHLEDNYILDKFHDQLLSDELHNALLKKGLIQEL